MGYKKNLNRQRQRRRYRVRNKVRGVATRSRLAVFRSAKHIYAQIIDVESGNCLVSASTVDKELRGEVGYGGNCAAAAIVGKAIGERAVKAGVTTAALDRREYKYHGRVAALANAARTAGLDLGAASPEKSKSGEDEDAKKGAKKGGKKKAKK